MKHFALLLCLLYLTRSGLPVAGQESRNIDHSLRMICPGPYILDVIHMKPAP